MCGDVCACAGVLALPAPARAPLLSLLKRLWWLAATTTPAPDGEAGARWGLLLLRLLKLLLSLLRLIPSPERVSSLVRVEGDGTRTTRSTAEHDAHGVSLFTCTTAPSSRLAAARAACCGLTTPSPDESFLVFFLKIRGRKTATWSLFILVSASGMFFFKEVWPWDGHHATQPRAPYHAGVHFASFKGFNRLPGVALNAHNEKERAAPSKRHKRRGACGEGEV